MGAGPDIPGTFLFHSIPLIGQQNGRPEAERGARLIKRLTWLSGHAASAESGGFADMLPARHARLAASAGKRHSAPVSFFESRFLLDSVP